MSRTSMFSTTVLLSLACIVGSGCTYIGPDYERQLKELLVDSDGDGDIDTSDCNDNNPNVNRFMEEIPYDGLDNDCSGGDLLDVDGDGYAGISKADWEAQDVDTDNATWNFNLPPEAENVDCADDPAVEPLASAIYPNNSNEKPYDGIDSNCDGENDFDLDGDGYMPNDFPAAAGGYESTAPAFEAFVTRWGYEGQFTAQYNDCDDTNASINESSAQDVWYDGVDSDCSGNNDFDQDGDGYMPEFAVVDGETVDVFGGAYQEFLDRFHNSTAPTSWFVNGAPNPDNDDEWDALPIVFDCVDGTSGSPLESMETRYSQPGTDGSPAYSAAEIEVLLMAPNEIYPYADDQPYDGIDADCQQDNDFDVDGDLAMPDNAQNPLGETIVVEDYFESYTNDWNYDFDEHSPDPVFGDCEDNNPDRSPLNIEILGDLVDQDCVGNEANADKAGLGMSNYTWTQPRSPQLVWNGDHIALGVMADQLYVDDVFLTDEAGMLFFFDPDTSQSHTVPTKELNWHGFGSAETQQLGDALDMYVDQYGATWISYTYQRWSTVGAFDSDSLCEDDPISSSCYTYLTVQEVEFNAEKDAYLSTRYYSSTHNSYYQGIDIDLLVDNNGPWAVACGLANKSGDDIPVVKTLRGVGVDDSRSDDLEGMAEVFPDATSETTYPVPSACFFVQSGLPSSNQAEFSVCNEENCATHSFNGTSSEITDSDAIDTWFPSLLSESSNIYAIDRDGMGDGGDKVELYTTRTSIGDTPYLSVFNEENELLTSFAGDYRAGSATQIGNMLYVATIPGTRSSENPTLWYGDLTDEGEFTDIASTVSLNNSEMDEITDVALLATTTSSGDNQLAVALTSTSEGAASEGLVAWSFWGLM